MIDLRSDICARPTTEMWRQMRRTSPGWLLTGEDIAVNELEKLAAARLGKEVGVWTPTCSVANLAALTTLGAPGSFVVADSEAHIFTSEAMGLAAVGGMHVAPVVSRDDQFEGRELGNTLVRLAAARIGAAPIVCVENTHTRLGGKVLTATRTREIAAIARSHGGSVHLDGARLFNAAVALAVDVATLAEPADTVAISLNKGLSAPFGAVLCGSAEVVERARLRLRQLGSASVHKAGYAAAAGLVALNRMVPRLAQDHRRARNLAKRTDGVAGLRVDPWPVETNIVLLDVSGSGQSAESFARQLRRLSVLCLERDEHRIRLVTHRGISDASVAQATKAIIAVAAGLA